MLELTALRYFVSAYETGTFSRAARACGVSQPTVSAAIQRLEDRLGGPLFGRAKTGLTPTPMARRLYHDAGPSVAHLAGLEARLEGAARPELRVHCAPDMLARALAPALNALRLGPGAPGFRFTDDAAQSDLAWVSEGCAPRGHGFIALREEPFRLAVAAAHPLAARAGGRAGVRAGVRVEDLAGLALIHRPYCPAADRMDLLPAGPAAQATDDAQVLELVAAGLGAAFVPLSHGVGRADLALLPLLGREAGTRRCGVAHRRTAFAARMAARLAEALGGAAEGPADGAAGDPADGAAEGAAKDGPEAG
ncbi:LysR family transcriptional regulator [Rhodovulum sp. DZ06]|uniref:LysR family transcriptional regulator n=1 Tax=Rhodovulum sp. DZ06 TaxID=3425126 RepID=UPI003D35936D